MLKFTAEVDGVQAEFKAVEKQLIDVYGDKVVIDLRTGEVKEPEKENKDGENK